MKLSSMMLLSAGLVLGAMSANAQDHNYVKDHPHETVIAHRPTKPGPNHVWVGAEWDFSGGKYVERPAHWEEPPHGRKTWHAGSWSHNAHGNYWVPGHWS